MRGLATTTVLVVAALAGSASPGQGSTLLHQGELTGLDGRAVADGSYPMAFSLWDAAQGGRLLWQEEHPAVAVRGGRFRVTLGSRVPVAPDPGEVWLETAVDGDLLEPRTKVEGTREDCTVEGRLTADELRLVHSGYTTYGDVDWHAGGLEITNYAETPISFRTTAGSVISTTLYLQNTGELRIGNWGSGFPQGRLEVNEGRTALRGGTDASLAAGSGYLVIGDDAGANLLLDTNEIMARTNGATSNLYLQQNGGDVYVNGSVVHTSDARLKRDVADLELGLAEVLRLRPVSFAWANRADDARRLGLVAQEVRGVVDEVVYEGQDGALGVAYESLVPVLVRAVQEQQAEIERLSAELEALRRQQGGPCGARP